MVAKAKKIRSISWECSNVNMVMGTQEEVTETLIFDEDVTIIGSQLELYLDVKEIDNPGSSWLRASLSQVAGYQPLRTIINQVRLGLLDYNPLVAVATGTGHNTERNLVMFPEGHGVDIDEGEGLTLTVTGVQRCDSTNATDGSGQATLFYVER